MATPTPNLTSLPNEILLIICETPDLTKTDLSSLRLTCKSLNVPVTLEFERRYFQQPVTMMIKPSLETLRDICQHPIFGTLVEEVQMLSESYHPSTGIPRGTPCDTSMQALHIPTNSVMMAKRYESSGEPLALLTDAFSALRKPGRSVVVSCRDMQGNLPIGFRKMFNVPDDRRLSCFNKEQDAMAKLRIMLDAVAATGLNTRKLKLCIDSCAEPEDETMDRLIQDTATRSVLIGLEDIGVELYTTRSPYDGYPAPIMVSPTLGRLLSVPPGLRKLSLSCRIGHRCGVQFQPDISELIRTGTLQHVCLTNVNVDETVLIHLLTSHMTTIKSLVLTKLILHGWWAVVLSFIAKSLALDRFVFYGAFEFRPMEHSARIWHGRSFNLNGRDETRLALEKLMDNGLELDLEL